MIATLLKNTNYYHREYGNDVGLKTEDVTLTDQCKRIALVALPFISLYKPFQFAISLGLSSCRAVSNISKVYSIIQTEDQKGISRQLLQTTVSVASIASTLLMHPLGILISTVNDLSIETASLADHICKGEYTQALESSANALNNALYLGMFLVGGLELSVASLTLQILIGLYHSREELLKGNYLEAAGHAGMACIRTGQLNEQIKLLRMKCEVQDLIKKIDSCKPSAQTELDLELHTQEFVIQTQQIQVADHPHAFNPSIIRWNGGILLSFRELDEQQKSHLGLVWIDEAMNPISPVQMISSEIKSGFEDVRLVSVLEKLYIVYSGTPTSPEIVENDQQKILGSSGYNVRIRAAELIYDKDFSIQNDECFVIFDGENPNKPEKNWVPFEHNGELLFSYSLSPHKVVKPIWGTGKCETVSSSTHQIESHLGELRGGTPGIPLENGKILGFFHTQQRMKSQHSLGKITPHYFMGAYLYSSDMPFEITHISPEPIIGPGFYNGKFYQPHWHDVNVVFPGGFIIQENDGEKYVWIAYGRQDHEVWATKINIDNLLKSLVGVETASFTLPSKGSDKFEFAS